MSDQSARRFDVLITAAEAYPALEALFMEAEDEIRAGFRIFDPWTKLRSDAARRVGETWFDLIAATLDRGVRITLVLTDFDPVVRPAMHSGTWQSVRGIIAAGEASRHPENVTVRAAMHPSRVGFLPRLLLAPKSLKEIRDKLADINGKSKTEKEDYLLHVPHLRPLVRWAKDQLRPRITPPPLVPVTHHQKLAVFDNKTLYAGGLDLNDRRYDTPEHQRAADQTWHDVQVIVDGPVVQEAADHLRSFEAVVHGAPPNKTQHLLRTMSARRKLDLPYLSPLPVVDEVAERHKDLISRSSRLIYLETQYFRDRTLARHLAKRAKQVPDLKLVLILPAAPDDIAFEDSPGPDVAYGEHLQVQSIKIVRDAFGNRVFIGSPAQPRSVAPDGRATHFGAPIIYLHAKVSIFDGMAGIVSSANLNGRSLAWDTEIGVQTEGTDEVELLRRRCFEHWQGKGVDPSFLDLDTAQPRWADRARDNARRAPEDREGFILPYLVDPAEKDAYDLPGVPAEMA